MKKYVSIIIFLFSLPIVAVAQLTPQKNRMVDTKATEIMESVVKEIKKYNTLKIVFTVDSKSAKGKTTQSYAGELLLKGKAYKGVLQGNEIYCNGKETWLYQKESNEVQWQTYDSQSEDMLNLSKFIVDYAKHFRPRFIKEETKNGIVYRVIDLLPKQSAYYYKVRLLLDKQKKKISSMTIHHKNGETVSYEVKKWLPDVAVNEKDFTFDVKAHPSVEIIDLR